MCKNAGKIDSQISNSIQLGSFIPNLKGGSVHKPRWGFNPIVLTDNF